jgi:N-acetylmuramoyl-L-alanine amidase
MLEDLIRPTARLSAFLFFLNGSSEALALKIVDYQRKLSPKFQKQIRPETRFIIIHSTESRLPSALRTLSRGKVWGGRYFTRGGHAHYLIAKNGTVYRILDPKYWANHAGVSMWRGLEGLSDYSLGIELEGYHNVPFSSAQYRALGRLLQILQKRYGIEDPDVLEHYRVAYSAPNHYHQDRLRGRKLDPGSDNFDRLKAGLTRDPLEDPDVIAGRIGPGLTLARAGGQTSRRKKKDPSWKLRRKVT